MQKFFSEEGKEMKKPMRKSLVVVLALIMAFAMSTSAFADTTSWTSFQGNDQNNGVISGNFSTAPTWEAVRLLDATKTTGWSGVDCQPLMTTENGKTYAYVVTDSNEGAKAFKVDCDTKTVVSGWQGGVPLTNIPTAQLGTGTIVNDTWYLPVSYDYQILPNAYMSYEGGWAIEKQNLTYRYDETDYTGLHFNTDNEAAGSAMMISNPQSIPINVDVEDIWADFSIQFGATPGAQMTDMNAQMYIKAQGQSSWIPLGGLSASDIRIGEVEEFSVNCTRQLQLAGMGGDRLYQLKLEFSFNGTTANEVIVKKAEVYKNNMFVKKIENISTATAPSAVTMIDYHTYSGTIDGGRGGQLNTPMVYINGNLFFGNWIRGDANGNNYAKYFKLNVNSNQLTTLDTGHTDDGFYLAGAAVRKTGARTYIVFGSDNSHLYMFNADTNALVSDVSDDIIGQIRSSICYDDGGIYFSTKSGIFYKYAVNSSRELTLIWSQNLSLPSNATPTVSDGVVYAAVGEFGHPLGKLYALNALTGEAVGGAYTAGGPVQSSLLIYETDENEVYAYYTVNSAVGKGYCKHFDQTPSGEEIGEAGYTLQGFAAANGYLVYGNDGVADAEYKYTVSVYVAQ